MFNKMCYFLSISDNINVKDNNLLCIAVLYYYTGVLRMLKIGIHQRLIHKDTYTSKAKAP